MKVLILAPANNTHTQRWCEALCKRGIAVVLFSFVSENSYFYKNLKIKVYQFGLNPLSSLDKFKYNLLRHKLKNIIQDEKPDIVHAHYASSYGFLGAQIGFHPFIVSVWGADIYDFPKNSIICKAIIRYTLSKCDKILSTSKVMANETRKYTDKDIDITPFGVDTNLFKKININASNEREFIVGIVKTLSPKYGIDILIKAFKLLTDRNINIKLKLIIIGDGPNRAEYENLVLELGLKNSVKFLGKIRNENLTAYYNTFSVFASTSILNSESFGVVAVEAMACECPVVVSDADGFTEVVENQVTGIIVPKKNIEATANAIQKFIDNPSLRESMGKNGRSRVLKLYNWEDNVTTMQNIYLSLL